VHEECYVARLTTHSGATAESKLPSQTKPRQWWEFERWQAAGEMTMIAQREKRFPLQMSRRRAEVAVAVAALAVACLIVYSGRRPSFSGASTLQRSIAAPAMRLHANRLSTPQARPVREEAKSAKPAFRQVQVGENEVDYVSDDVTMRYFSYHPAVQRGRAGPRQFDIGEDVTVRYFQHDAAVASATRPASNSAHPEERSLPGPGKPGSSKLAR
jgi:hypothetical protein